jgi:hypothetical protein
VSKDIDELVKQAKKELTLEQIKQAIRDNTYGGKPIDMSMKGGGMVIGKTNT